MNAQPKIKEAAGAGSRRDDSKGHLLSGGLTRIRSGSLDRLPSLRPKRDLTLGGVPKKTFSPTIPTSRRVKKEPGTSDGVTDGGRLHDESSPKGGKRRSSLDKKGGKEMKKRVKKEVVPAASVFSMGPADRPVEGRQAVIPGTFGAEFAKRTSLADRDGSTGRVRDSHLPGSVGRGSEEEEEACPVGGTVEELFRDSVIPPVQLPLDYTSHIKQRTLPVVTAKSVKGVKQEPRDNGGIEDMDTAESSNLSSKSAKPPVSAEVKGHQVTAAELFTPNENVKGKFLFIQLPDCLPISMTTGKGIHQPMEVDKSSRASSVITTASGTSVVTSEGEPTEQRHCSLADVPEGVIGKLRVHKSGKVKLSLGEVTMDVAMGTSCGFLQQLVSVRHAPPQPKMTVLGQLSHRLVCSPDFETMLEKVSRENL